MEYNKNKNYLKKFFNNNKGSEGNIENYILPTLRYIQTKIIQSTSNYLNVYENLDKGEQLSIENYYEIRDKLMFLVMLDDYEADLHNYLDSVCEVLHIDGQVYLEGNLESRLRYLALLMLQYKGIIGPSTFDFKTVENITMPGEPIASLLSKLTIEVLVEFTAVEDIKDRENIFKVLLSVMAYLVMFRIKTDWED